MNEGQRRLREEKRTGKNRKYADADADADADAAKKNAAQFAVQPIVVAFLLVRPLPSVLACDVAPPLLTTTATTRSLRKASAVAESVRQEEPARRRMV